MGLFTACAMFLLALIFVLCAKDECDNNHHGTGITMLLVAAGLSIMGVWQCLVL